MSMGCSPTTGNARHGWRVSAPARRTSLMKTSSSRRLIRWPHTLRPISTSTACSNWRDEDAGDRGDERNQDRIGVTIEQQRRANVRGGGVAAAVAHRGVVDFYAAIDARAGERQAERA